MNISQSFKKAEARTKGPRTIFDFQALNQALNPEELERKRRERAGASSAPFGQTGIRETFGG